MRRSGVFVIVAMGLCVATVPHAVSVKAHGPGGWTSTGPMMTNRDSATATLLPDGTVLVAGGCCDFNSSNGLNLASAELYHPRTNRWTPTGRMNTGVSGQTATLLPNGKVLVVCNYIGDGAPLSVAQLYDPRTGHWTATQHMHVARANCTATLLPNGMVLVAGGEGASGPLDSAELYDPHTGKWTFTGSMRAARESHTATLLRNGLVLVAGGTLPPSILNLFAPLVTAELYNPRTGTWAPTHPMTALRGNHTATLLRDGRVLVAGGGHNGFLNSAEIYDPHTQRWIATGAMHVARSGHTATLLPNGTVLAVGGADVRKAEVYDPHTGAWTVIGPMHHFHDGDAATLLPSGKVLIVGGTNPSGNPSGAELYDPGTIR